MAKATIIGTRDLILAVSDIRTEQLFIPEWKMTVNVRGMTGSERDEFEQSILQQKGKDTKVNTRGARAKLVVLSVVDDDGNRLFRTEDVFLLGEKSAAALDRIFDVASRLSGISDDDMEELAGNSESDQSADSISV